MNSRVKTPSRLLLTVAFAISAMLLGIIGAVAAGTGPVAPPPKIAFVTTNANVAPDALTVGPMAGRLGAPLFITNKDNLGESTKNALVAYGADLIIVAGGPNTVTDGVLNEIAAATGLTIKDAADTPDTGIIRVSGDGRDETAVELSKLIAAYNPKFLPTDATAADSELLDGKDSTEFLGATAKAADADKLDGMDSTAFASAAHDHLVAFASNTAGVAATTSTFVDFVTADITLPDVCPGADSWNVLVEGSGYAWASEANVLAQTELDLDGSSPVGTQLNIDIVTDGTRVPFSQQYLFTGIDSGAHTAKLIGNSFNGADYEGWRTKLTVMALGYTCP